MRIIRSRQETRDRILQSTQMLLERNSAQQFQIRDVAREAGVSASLIIQYFNSKNDLVFETALRRLEGVHAEIAASFAKAPPESLPAVLRAFLEADWAISHVIRDLLSLSWWWSQADEARVVEVFRPRHEAVRAALAAAGGHATDIRVEAILGAYFAAFRRGCVTGATHDEVFAAILDRVDAQ